MVIYQLLKICQNFQIATAVIDQPGLQDINVDYKFMFYNIFNAIVENNSS